MSLFELVTKCPFATSLPAQPCPALPPPRAPPSHQLIPLLLCLTGHFPTWPWRHGVSIPGAGSGWHVWFAKCTSWPSAAAFPWGHLRDLCGALGWGRQPFLHQPRRERQGIAAGSCLHLNIYDPGSLAAPHPPRVDFVLPSGIADKHCGFSSPWQGWQLGWAWTRASLLCKATSEVPQGGDKGLLPALEIPTSLSRRFPPPCPPCLQLQGFVCCPQRGLVLGGLLGGFRLPGCVK